MPYCDDASCWGFCNSCGYNHALALQPAMAEAQKLMQMLGTSKHIDCGKQTGKSEGTSTDFLYGDARGKMFGVLVCEKTDGERLILKAFSGQYNGLWEIEGWAPPLFNVQNFWQLLIPIEKQIKELGKELRNKTKSSIEHAKIRQQRKELSQNLMKQIHALYRLHNFKKQQCSLVDLFPRRQGIPTGTGDCCAPKLLNFAARKQLKPVSLAEFYWGKTNKSATRSQGTFYPACTDKCGPILGFLLCGAEGL
jgi:hypothetical protein